MKSISYYIKNYGEAIWVLLMGTLCVLDIYVLSIDWNVFSLIGAIFCGLSVVMNLTQLIRKIVHNYRFYGRFVL